MNSVLCVWLLSAIACGYAIAITDYCDVDCRNDVHIACNNSGVSLVYLIEVWAIQLFIDHIKHLVDVAWPILCVCERWIIYRVCWNQQFGSPKLKSMPID